MLSSGGYLGTCYRHGLVGRAFKTAIVNATPKKAMAKAAKAYVLGRGPEEYRKAVVGPLFNHHDGIERLYRMFVDHCQEEIGRCLTAIASEIQHPFVVYCNHGKDRTGWICALIHHVCGVPRPEIIANYAVSDENLEPIAAMTEEEMRSGGLDPKILCRSPAKAMEATFHYVEATFGSVENYLDAIGFGPTLRAQLRTRLVDIADSSPLLVSQPVTANIPDHHTHISSFVPQDADEHGVLQTRTNGAPLRFQGELHPGQYQLSVEGLHLWIDATALLQVFFRVSIADSPAAPQILTATSLHQSSTTTITRPFSLAALSNFTLEIGCTSEAASDVSLKISIRPFPFISAIPKSASISSLESSPHESPVHETIKSETPSKSPSRSSRQTRVVRKKVN